VRKTALPIEQREAIGDHDEAGVGMLSERGVVASEMITVDPAARERESREEGP
jgi:hypothetical protein